MHGGWQLFCPTLLVEVEEKLLKWWIALYAFARVWRRGEGEKHTWGGWGEVMSAGARRACEWSTEIRPKASQVHALLLPFIFATSPCLIYFDGNRPSQL
jgi:hypothetical protein